VSSPSGTKGKFWLRITGLILGIGVLMWLPVEERSELGVLVISGAICTWSAIWFLIKPALNDKQLILRHVLVGTGAGLLLAPLVILLMAFKSGIHGYGTPDFTVSQMQDILFRIPYFVLSGFLVGLGSGLWRMLRRDTSQEEG
jgi:hypothetical protein